jgi:CheY-like chemotaxis protein
MAESQIVLEITRQLTGILSILLVLSAILIFKPQLQALISRVESLKFRGLEATLGPALEAAGVARHVTIPRGSKDRLARRVQREHVALEGASVLWVDGHPENNVSERQALETMGIGVTLAASDAKAWEAISQTDFGLILSNVGRDGAGIRFAETLRKRCHPTPLTFYTRPERVAEASPKAFAATARPDDLLHYVIDVLARHRG